MMPRTFAPALAIALCFVMSATASAQTPLAAPGGGPADSGMVTLLTTPRTTQVRLLGRTQYLGPSPLEIPTWMNGRYSVVVEGVGVSRTQGVVYLPTRQGDRPKLASEPPGLSIGLLVRSFNLPGVPDITARRPYRGFALALAGAGAGYGALNAHLQYRDRLREFGAYAENRARDERHERNNWFTYGLSVWGASAVDYWIRPRFQFEDSDPSHAVLSVPPVTRTGVAWRSLVVPGAGQEFGNQRARGAVWLGAFLAAGAGFTLADNQVKRDQTQLDWARLMVDSVGPSLRAKQLRQVEVATNDLQTSQDVMRGFRLALIGIYAANVVDALVMPIRRAPDAEPPRVSATFPVGPDRAAVSLHYRF